MHFDTLQGWLAWQESLHPKAIDLGLERAAKVYHALNPLAQKPITLTVAGTNGKGSTIAFLEAIYRAQGFRVACYTSPHILKYNERIKIDGQPVDDATICAAFERIEAVRAGGSLSYFEFGTLAALDIFRRANVDVQLLEVGLGGRLDAVNIVDHDIAVITSISIDHCDWLGETREAIALEKAGILRTAIPAVICDTAPPLSLRQSISQKRAIGYFIGEDFQVKKHDDCWLWQFDDVALAGLPFPALQGEHQFTNAAGALLAVHLMKPVLPVSNQAITQGLKDVRLSGRYQLVDGEPPILLDVGHNPEAVTALAKYLKMQYPKKNIHAVFAMMKDKDIKGVLKIMQPLVKHWYVAPLKNPRCADRSMMQQAFQANNMTNVSFGTTDFLQTYQLMCAQVAKEDVIVVFGSFFLVSEYLAMHECENANEDFR